MKISSLFRVLKKDTHFFTGLLIFLVFSHEINRLKIIIIIIK